MYDNKQKEVKNVFMRGFAPTLPNIVAERTKSLAEDIKNQGLNNVFMKEIIDAAGNIAEYVPTLVPIDNDGKVCEGGPTQKTITKKYKVIGGQEVEVQYRVLRDTETDRDVIRPVSWESDNKDIFKELAGTFQLIADIFPLETGVRTMSEIDNLPAKFSGWVGRLALDRISGRSEGDASLGLKAEELRSLLMFSRGQLLLALRNHAEWYKALVDAIDSGSNIRKTDFTVDITNLVKSMVQTVKEEDTQIIDGKENRPVINKRLESGINSLNFGANRAPSVETGFTFGKKK